MTTGLICAYNEASFITEAVRSLFDAGCGRVVVVDGHWTPAFGPPHSTDGTGELVREAGAVWSQPPITWSTDGGKRDAALRIVGPADHVLLLDADERLVGRLPELPEGHACIMLRNLRENDLPGIRGTWPRGDYGPRVPLLRLLRWSPRLRCEAPGRYLDHGRPIRPYVARVDRVPPEKATALPLLAGIEIEHYGDPGGARIEAKRAYYGSLKKQ